MKIIGFYHNPKLINSCKVVIPQVLKGLMVMGFTFTFTDDAVSLLAPYIDINGIYQCTNHGVIDGNLVKHLYQAVNDSMSHNLIK